MNGSGQPFVYLSRVKTITWWRMQFIENMLWPDFYAVHRRVKKKTSGRQPLKVDWGPLAPPHLHPVPAPKQKGYQSAPLENLHSSAYLDWHTTQVPQCYKQKRRSKSPSIQFGLGKAPQLCFTNSYTCTPLATFCMCFTSLGPISNGCSSFTLCCGCFAA